jgi:hypothetical protein
VLSGPAASTRYEVVIEVPPPAIAPDVVTVVPPLETAAELTGTFAVEVVEPLLGTVEPPLVTTVVSVPPDVTTAESTAVVTGAEVTAEVAGADANAGAMDELALRLA